MIKKIALFLFALLPVFSFATTNTFDVNVEVENISNKINDGKATIVVKGGEAPYSYYWSNQNTELTSNTSRKLVEGVEHKVVVTDAKGDVVEKTFVIKTSNTSEFLNASFVPLVEVMYSFLFWDPFAAMSLYDNNIYNDNGQQLFHKNGDPQKKNIPFIVVWLVLGSIFFTIKMGFINIRGFKHAIQLVQGKFDNPNNKDSGEVSHFQALVTALSGTVGLGNIAGVAVAITVGGAGATFWMIIAGLIGMSAKFVECTLGVKYRNVNSDGEVAGGPMYYLSKGLKKRNLGVLGKTLAIVFAVLCVGASFGGGNMFQANQAFSQVSGQFPGIESFHLFGIGGGTAFGIILAIFVGVVIIGGIKSIASVTDKIVPVMVGIYVITALIIIFMNITNVGHAISSILEGAFSPEAAKGGVIGVLIMGFRRAAFSNEAGVGSASIAHSAAKTEKPVSEGIVALLEPFVDTVVICTMTALVLIFTGFADDTQGLEGAELTSAAFSSVFSWFNWVLLIAIVLFAFSTMISWSYYGQKAWSYLFGESKNMGYLYKGLFLIFVVIGASTGLGAVLDFSDLMILGMAFPNIIGLLIMSDEVREDLKQYLADVKSGVIKKFK